MTGSPICFTKPGLGVVLEHATYVVAEAGVLILLAQRARRDALTGEELTRITDRLIDTQGTMDFTAAHGAVLQGLGQPGQETRRIAVFTQDAALLA